MGDQKPKKGVHLCVSRIRVESHIELDEREGGEAGFLTSGSF